MSGRVQGIKGGREREEGETGKESFDGLGTNKTNTGLEVVWKGYLHLLTQVVFLGFRSTSKGPSSSKFPNPVEDPPGPPCTRQIRNMYHNSWNTHT